jgi:hypothetical protein
MNQDKSETMDAAEKLMLDLMSALFPFATLQPRYSRGQPRGAIVPF